MFVLFLQKTIIILPQRTIHLLWYKVRFLTRLQRLSQILGNLFICQVADLKSRHLITKVLLIK